MSRVRATWVLLAIVITSTVMTMLAMRRTSTTFDEITVIAAGARGWRTGDFAAMPNYPPVTQYLYGLPAFLTGPVYPAEARPDTAPQRYVYAREFMFSSGNDPERLAFVARLGAVLTAGLLIFATYAFAVRYIGVGGGILAAALVAFLPDVLAHGGVAYNDLPLALAFFVAVWLTDATLRRPRASVAAGAGLAISVAVGTKYSALVLGPIALTLLVVEVLHRFRQPAFGEWLKSTALCITIATVVGYLFQVAIYEGDFALTFLREGALGAQAHIVGGHGVPAYLRGQFYPDAPWYFYPAQFLFKTSAALHVLMLFAFAGAVLVLSKRGWRDWLGSPLRAPFIALLIFTAFLMRSNLTIGFRYALPVLPLICVLTAAGVAAFWPHASRMVRGTIALLVVWSSISALVYYPHFLAYTSEYQSDPDFGLYTFVDSSLDWGQGLLELRDFMKSEGIPSVYLSYFGSALPEAYGIKYVPLPSFFPLPNQQPTTEAPRFIAVSATNLVGLYFPADPFAKLRAAEPYRVLGHSIFVYRAAP